MCIGYNIIQYICTYNSNKT